MSLHRLILLGCLGALAACGRTHGAAIEVTRSDCVACHLADYQGTTMPDHEADGKPTTCGDCHGTRAWTPAAGAHPEARFPIAAGPHLRDCLDCHKASVGPTFTMGANTDCVGCHTGEHARAVVEVTHIDYPGYVWDAANPHFCLSCHPKGLAAGGGHPEDRFPQETGPHRGLMCKDCHDETRGANTAGVNTDCIGCHLGTHVRSAVESTHVAYPGFLWDATRPNFCLSCHPRGLAGGGGHPESRFPIASGAHAFACLDCHDPARGVSTGGMNTDCVGCHTGEHTRARVDDQHGEVGDYVFALDRPNFCLECHPNGRH